MKGMQMNQMKNLSDIKTITGINLATNTHTVRSFLVQTLILLSIVLIQSIAMAQHQNKKDGRPNIVFIMSDDHAYQAISAYSNKLIETPNIDRIAKMGMLFTQASVTNSICAPSRATILTGKHSHRNGKIDN